MEKIINSSVYACNTGSCGCKSPCSSGPSGHSGITKNIVTPPHWVDIYPQGTKAGDEEQKFFIALGRHKEFDWRSVAALAKETGLSEERIEEIIQKYVKKNMVFNNPKNEDQWGYWERVPQMLKDDTSVTDADQDARIDKIIGCATNPAGKLKALEDKMKDYGFVSTTNTKDSKTITIPARPIFDSLSSTSETHPKLFSHVTIDPNAFKPREELKKRYSEAKFMDEYYCKWSSAQEPPNDFWIPRECQLSFDFAKEETVVKALNTPEGKQMFKDSVEKYLSLFKQISPESILLGHKGTSIFE